MDGAVNHILTILDNMIRGLSVKVVDASNKINIVHQRLMKSCTNKY